MRLAFKHNLPTRLQPSGEHVKLSFTSRMPASALVHTAVFMAGALLGGGITAVASSRKIQSSPSVQVAPAAPTNTSAPVLEVRPNGGMQVSEVALAASGLPSVLKYGNPGE